eukprot:7031264-Prymnesium_polylepis.1
MPGTNELRRPEVPPGTHELRRPAGLVAHSLPPASPLGLRSGAAVLFDTENATRDPRRWPAR